MTIYSLRDITPDQAAYIVQRSAYANPKYLRQYYGKIKERLYIPTVTSPTDLAPKCWMWTGATDKGNGDIYPKIKVGGKTRRVHRWIFSVLVRPLRVDEDAHHLCECSLCVNPYHIEARASEKHSKRGPPSNWDGSTIIPDNSDIPF